MIFIFKLSQKYLPMLSFLKNFFNYKHSQILVTLILLAQTQLCYSAIIFVISSGQVFKILKFDRLFMYFQCFITQHLKKKTF